MFLSSPFPHYPHCHYPYPLPHWRCRNLPFWLSWSSLDEILLHHLLSPISQPQSIQAFPTVSNSKLLLQTAQPSDLHAHFPMPCSLPPLQSPIQVPSSQTPSLIVPATLSIPLLNHWVLHSPLQHLLPCPAPRFILCISKCALSFLKTRGRDFSSLVFSVALNTAVDTQ